MILIPEILTIGNALTFSIIIFSYPQMLLQTTIISNIYATRLKQLKRDMTLGQAEYL